MKYKVLTYDRHMVSEYWISLEDLLNDNEFNEKYHMIQVLKYTDKYEFKLLVTEK